MIDQLSKALQVAIKDPAVTQRFADLGAVPVTEADATPGGIAGAREERSRALGADHQGRRPVRGLGARRYVMIQSNQIY